MSWEPLRSPDETVRPVDETLGQLHHRLGLARPDVFAQVERHWPAIVGAALATRCRPTSIRSGELVVSTPDPGTAEQLRWSAADLAAAVAAVVGEDTVGTVVVKVVPLGRALDAGVDAPTDVTGSAAGSGTIGGRHLGGEA